MQLPSLLTGNGGAENACRYHLKPSKVDMLLLHVSYAQAGMQGDVNYSVFHFKAVASV